MDALSHFLALHAVTTTLDWRCELNAPWRLVNEGTAPGILPYHLVTEGEAWLEMAERETVRLHAGDLLMLPHGSPHVLHAGDVAAPLPDVLPAGATARGTLKSTGPGRRSEILCGEFVLDAATSGLLIRSLPEVVLLKAQDRESQLHQLMLMLKREAREQLPGARIVVQHLASTLFSLLIRGWLREAALPGNMLRLLAEPRLHLAVQAMLESPGRPWTLQALAARCYMSRATFVRLFKQVAGQAPGSFLTSVRLLQAARLLEQPGFSIAAISEMVGYASEPAFHRMFKQRMGMPPGTFRRRKETEG